MPLFQLESCPRLPRFLPWAGLLALAGAGYLALGGSLPSCTFKLLTGLPCPTCGGTRAAHALLQGRPGLALACNPLLVLGGAALLGAILLRAGSARTLRIHWTPRLRRLTVALAAAAVLGNWLYLVRHGL